MFKYNMNSPEQPVELTQKWATDTKTPNSLYPYFVIVMVGLLKVLNAVELHFLKSLKVSYLNTACSSSMRSIFDK